MKDLLEQLFENRWISSLDYYFAKTLQRLSPKGPSSVPLMGALVSMASSKGHVCLKIQRIEEPDFFSYDLKEPAELVFPATESWLSDLKNSSLVGFEDGSKPLVLDQKDRVYLSRFWKYQERVISFVLGQIQNIDFSIDLKPVQKAFQAVFHSTQAELDMQQVACVGSLFSKFFIVTGGPGTGKTHTAVRLLALHQAHQKEKGLEPYRISLLAPTGKAAARLSESVGKGLEELSCDEKIKQSIEVEAKTIHRELGVMPSGSGYLKHHKDNPMPYDLVMVDEASMIDLALFSKLVDAIKPESRLVLLGDKDQLSPVGAGSVLGDICGEKALSSFSDGFQKAIKEVVGLDLTTQQKRASKPGIWDAVVPLEKNYRMKEAAELLTFAQAINKGEPERLASLVQKNGAIELIEGDEKSLNQKRLNDILLSEFAPIFDEKDPSSLLGAFGRFRVLCMLNEGPEGVDEMNHRVEELLKKKGVIRSESNWYPGKPVMVIKNDAQLGLYNGDGGVVVLDENQNPKVCFWDAQGKTRLVSIQRLPPHKTAYAITVHKSQGSEFQRVLLMVSPKAGLLLSKEIFYTGVTRAKQKVILFDEQRVLLEKSLKRVGRDSAISERITS